MGDSGVSALGATTGLAYVGRLKLLDGPRPVRDDFGGLVTLMCGTCGVLDTFSL